MHHPMIVIIAALARENRCIGDRMRLPWHVPEDMRRFKRLTLGFPMIMGRVTCEGLIRDFGQPLPGRRTLALTRNPGALIHPQIECCVSLGVALKRVKTAEKVFIAGGAKIYEEALSLADRLELTLIDGAYQGDTFFPAYEHLIGTVFALSHEDPHEGFSFVTYDRIPSSPKRDPHHPPG